MREPFYSADGITLFCGDAREILPSIGSDVLVTDPPYGIEYHSNRPRVEGNARSIVGDETTEVRDAILSLWGTDRPALIFGTWRTPRPAGTRGVLVWDKGGALGMGDLSMPWKFDHEEIYVVGRGFTGSRDSGSVLHCPPEQSMGRLHPHQKPLRLMSMLLAKCPRGVVVDPFAGSGSTLRAAKDLGRAAVGIEIDGDYCEKIARRLSQRVLPIGGAA